MEDRYLFKTKRTDNGEWVEGYLFRLSENHPPFIMLSDRYGESHEVDPSTICQCTGMPDKNSKVAYEHDIIETPVGNAKIIWNCSPSQTDNHINVGFEVVFLDATANDNYRHDLGYWIGKSEVIGNIFDNAELLESEE